MKLIIRHGVYNIIEKSRKSFNIKMEKITQIKFRNYTVLLLLKG